MTGRAHPMMLVTDVCWRKYSHVDAPRLQPSGLRRLGTKPLGPQGTICWINTILLRNSGHLSDK